MEGIIYVTIYLDVIMLICFIFNGAILFVVTYMMKQERSYTKLFFGTTLATLFVPVVVYFPDSFFNTIAGKIFFSIAIILITIGFKPIYILVKSLMTFYVVSFVVGGAILSVHYMLAYSVQTSFRNLLLYVDNVYHSEVSLVIIFIGFPLTLFMTKVWSDKLAIQHFMSDQLYRITLSLNDKQHTTTAFLDSGNHLVDPLTNRPVIVCDATFLQTFFSEEDWLNVTNAIKKNEPQHIPIHLTNKISIIPFKSVADHHYLYAIKPDKLTIYMNTTAIKTKNVLVGIQLSSITNDDAYHCLLHPQLITLQPYKIVS